MIIVESFMKSTWFQTQDRYKLQRGDGDKGIKRASLWERITFRATKIVMKDPTGADKTYYVNKRSLNKYISRKCLSSDTVAKKTQAMVQGFFKASELKNNAAQRLDSPKEIPSRRGKILKTISISGKSMKISEEGIKESDVWASEMILVHNGRKDRGVPDFLNPVMPSAGRYPG